MMTGWAVDEGWNQGLSDRIPFAAADPHGFLVGRLDGEPVACVSAVRYGADYGFLGYYIVRPELRGQGYGMRMWRAAMERLEGRTVGLCGVFAQQDNYRKSGFQAAWDAVGFVGTPRPAGPLPDGVTIVDAGTLPFAELAAYDRRFFPAPRDAFLATWTTLPDRTTLAAVQDGRIRALGVIRPGSGPIRIGPLYADTPDLASALLRALGAAMPGEITVDVPEANADAIAVMEECGLRETGRMAWMYRGEAPDVDVPGFYGVTSCELG
ncbi:GNAT family N-acetyltransferase [Yinghuangia seranimata]|uniref:GNAT family N-acetyltransferase n=1 Tax=Yinghuangia seranimata TaxID=408067 RepID=UPI003CCF8CC9